MKHPPKLVCALGYDCDAWVVGSGADRSRTEEPRDWDVIVPFARWRGAAFLIPKEATPNTFGGWKCIENGVEIDVWPDELTSLFTSAHMKYAWHIRSNTFVEKVK